MPATVQDLDLPIVALDEADEVHELAATHRIMQHVPARAEPIRAQHPCDVGGQPFHRNQAAPCHAAGELGPVGSEQAFADSRVNAVGAEHERGTHRFAALETHVNVLVGLIEVDAPAAELDRVRLEAPDRVGEQAVQVSAMQHDVRVP